MIDIFRGKELHGLALDDVRELLDDAESEPLHWEAKGIAIKPGEVRRQICGFANSHDGGFLILGTDVQDGAWVLDGVEFPTDDLPSWVSSVAEGVQPYPDGLDTQPIRVDDRRRIAVVWVPPTPTAPCNAHGTVYERVSGRTGQRSRPVAPIVALRPRRERLEHLRPGGHEGLLELPPARGGLARSPMEGPSPLALPTPSVEPAERPEYGRVNMRVRLIFAALAVGVSPLAGCGSTPSHRPAAREPREQVVTVTGAVGPPKSPKEKQLARELKGVEGSSP